MGVWDEPEMRWLTGGSLLALALAASSPAAGEVLCGETFTSAEALEAVIKTRPGVKVLASDASAVSYSDPATSFIWNFAKKANEAFPSVACRRLVKAGGAFNVVTEIECGAAKAACDRLAASYNELDRKMRESVEKEHKH
jgi:hypothetical protein